MFAIGKNDFDAEARAGRAGKALGTNRASAVIAIIANITIASQAAG